MSVSPEKGVYYCFGCQRSGDVITFVQEIEGLDFAGAVEMLAGRAGISVRYDSRDQSAARSRRRRLLEAVASARDYYHQRLLSGRDAGPARKLSAVPGATTATWCGGGRSAGRPTTGTLWPATWACPTTTCATPVSDS